MLSMLKFNGAYDLRCVQALREYQKWTVSNDLKQILLAVDYEKVYDFSPSVPYLNNAHKGMATLVLCKLLDLRRHSRVIQKADRVKTKIPR